MVKKVAEKRFGVVKTLYSFKPTHVSTSDSSLISQGPSTKQYPYMSTFAYRNDVWETDDFMVQRKGRKDVSMYRGAKYF